MTVPIDCRLVGTWRITEADLWDHGYLDLCGPATLVIQDDGHGAIAFGALQAGLEPVVNSRRSFADDQEARILIAPP